MINSSSRPDRYEALMWSASTTAQALGIGRGTLWRWVARQRFPTPDLALGARLRRWRRTTVLAWVEAHAPHLSQPHPESQDEPAPFPSMPETELPQENQ